MSSGRDFKRMLLIGGAILFGALVFFVAINPFMLFLPLVWTGRLLEPHRDAAFQEAHQRAINSFVESRGFGFARLQYPRFWNDRTITFNGRIYQPQSIHLIGLTPERGDRYFDSGTWPAKGELTNQHPRSLSEAESGAVEKLREAAPFVALADPAVTNSVRVFAPVPARAECLKCHPVSGGTLLGAFVYSLTLED